MVFTRQAPCSEDAEGIPGRLGTEVREKLARDPGPEGMADAGLVALGRLLCELDGR
jgi:hypothetical protein